MNEQEKSIGNGKWKIFVAFGILISVAIIIAGYWFFFLRGTITTDDARLAGGLLDLAPQISGLLQEIYVDEGDEIHKDQVLFVLDKELLENRLIKAETDVKAAESNLAIAQAQYEKSLHGPLKNEIGIAENAYRKAEAELKLSKAEWDRAKTLYDENVTTMSSTDKKRTDWEKARHAYEEAKNRLELLKDGTRTEDLDVARANVALKEKQLAAAIATEKQARINLEYTTIRSPFNGLVVRRWQDPGAVISSGRPILTLLNPKELYVAANIKEQYLNRIFPDDRVDISIDAFPDAKLSGRVEKIMRAANSQFSLIPAESASGTYIKVAQRIPIHIRIDTLPDLPLGPGLSAVIRIRLKE